MTDPKRLRELPDLPVSLRDALRTLEQQAPAPETVARVQRALEALPAAGASAAFGFGWGAALFIATLGALGLSGWAFLSQLRDPGATEPYAADAAQPTPTAAVAVPAASTPASVAEAPQPVARSLDSAPRRAAPEPARATSSGMPVRHDSARASRVRSRDANAHADLAAIGAPQSAAIGAPPSAATAALDTLAPAVIAPEPQAAESAAEVNEPEARAPAKQALVVGPAPGPEPEDEAGLLYRAKRLARSDPARALRLAESHADHFPQGAYVEEREVLAIELEHRLGHEAEAKQRAARFLARFPRSAYRAAVRR